MEWLWWENYEDGELHVVRLGSGRLVYVLHVEGLYFLFRRVCDIFKDNYVSCVDDESTLNKLLEYENKRAIG